MASKTSEQIFHEIDTLFYENKPKEAEQFMLDTLEEAEKEGSDDIALLLYNELIGYYRQTSEKEKLKNVIAQSVKLAERMQIQGTIPYATTMVNAANAYRSMGELKSAKSYYAVADGIYKAKVSEGQLSEQDLLLAGLYNNMSLLYQEMQDYKTAESYQLKSLEIVKALDSWFEIAVSNANLANTYLLSRDFEKSALYAQNAMAIFEEKGLQDPHYAAALSALGNCYLEKGERSKAKETFERALLIVEKTIGRNSQYERLIDNLKLCEDADSKKEEKMEEKVSGLELSRAYYEAYGKQMIAEKFPDYVSKIAVGLVGEGSDCFGYDDEYSKDHDYGPDFCLWLSDETYDEIGEALQTEYENLPKTFRGITRTTTEMGTGRRGVCKINDFYGRFLGNANLAEANLVTVPDYALAACTNGAVFTDEEGLFTEIRNLLKAGYPANIRLMKLAEDVANFSQTGQYNYGRMLKRGDRLTADLMLHDFCKHAMRLYHHMSNVYPPHDKWLVKSTSMLAGGDEVVSMLQSILEQNSKAEKSKAVEEMVERLAQAFADSLYATGEISDTDSYLDHHVQELLVKAGIARLSQDELVEMIVRLEFEAFDKVQNEGGRASCQNNWPTFSIMRKSQYLTWNQEMLMQYYYDFKREYEMGHNLITEKYGRMMESTDQKRYDEIKENFPELSEEKKAVIEQIVGVQMQMVDDFAKEYPHVVGNARNLHTYEDEIFDTSYETYLRGEISTYSDKMLQLYGQFVVKKAMDGENIARLTIGNTAKLYGYANIDELEKSIKD